MLAENARREAATADGESGAPDFDEYLLADSHVLHNSAVLSQVDGTTFDAVILPGGHAPMVDLATDAFLGRLLVEANRANTIIAEELQGGLGENAPYFLASTLADLGADLVLSDP